MKLRRGFTLVELLIVVAIIGLLMAILLTALSGFWQTETRLACQVNLKNIHTVMFNYAKNWKGLLPCPCDFESFLELTGTNASPGDHFYKVEALKDVGATPKLFTCPAYKVMVGEVTDLMSQTIDAADASGHALVWDAPWWSGYNNAAGIDKPRKQAATLGYAFFIGADNAYIDPNYLTNTSATAGSYYKAFPESSMPDRLCRPLPAGVTGWSGSAGLGRPFAKTNQDTGNPPLAADLMWINRSSNHGTPGCNTTFTGGGETGIAGFHHKDDRELVTLSSPDANTWQQQVSEYYCTDVGGGGWTLFLDSSVVWFSWDDLVAQGPGYIYNPPSSSSPPYMPVGDYYFGLAPPGGQ